MRASIPRPERFTYRHIGPRPEDIDDMVQGLGYASLDALIDAVVPDDIRLRRKLALPKGRTERDVLRSLRALAGQNEIFRSYLGMGYYGTFTPQVIQRNILENPGWYTAYTPYQAEISQGRLEALLNYQTVVADLTALPIANASLLDEATAAAEAMWMTEAIAKKRERPVYLVDEACHPQTIAVVRTRAAGRGPRGEGPAGRAVRVRARQVVGALVQYPATDGRVADYRAAGRAGARGRRPRHRGHRPAGAHAARAARRVGRRHRGRQLAAVRRADGLRRPARGVLRDQGRLQAAHAGTHHRREQGRRRPARAPDGAPDPRAAHPPRQGDEQHLHGAGAPGGHGEHVRGVPRARRASAASPTGCTGSPARSPPRSGGWGYTLVHEAFFDTLAIEVERWALPGIVDAARNRRINLRVLSPTRLSVALDETVSLSDVADLIAAFALDEALPFMMDEARSEAVEAIPESLRRTSAFLTHPVFHLNRSETEMLRYIKRLEARDLSLTAAMIPLGSCTMKLNATTEMMPVSWREFNRLHPFAPARPDRRATSGSSSSSASSWPRSPASRRCRCSRTPARRASWPACS